jgi:hypothetical protein
MRTALSHEPFEAYKANHEREFAVLRDEVSKFIVAQLEAYPDISPIDLRGQLDRILGGSLSFVARVSSSVRPATWAVLYGQTAYYGWGGARIVVDSYVLEHGKARLVGRGGSELDGTEFNAEQITFADDSVSVLVYGILTWSSGHELPSRATLYNLNADGVKVLLRLDVPGFGFIGKSYGSFTVTYHDEDRHTKGLKSRVVDIYALTYPIGKPRRVSHIYPEKPRAPTAVGR